MGLSKKVYLYVQKFALNITFNIMLYSESVVYDRKCSRIYQIYSVKDGAINCMLAQ